MGQLLRARPPKRCNTLGRASFIRVPLPAAMMTTSIGVAMKFPLDGGGWFKPGRQRAGSPRIIGLLATLAAALLLQACSAIKLALQPGTRAGLLVSGRLWTSPTPSGRR